MWCSYTLPFLKPSRVLHLIHKRAVFFEIVDIIKEATSRVKMRGSCVPPLTTHGGRSNTCCRCFVSQYPSTFQKIRSVRGDFESTCTVVNMDGCVVVRSGGIGTCVVVLFCVVVFACELVFEREAREFLFILSLSHTDRNSLSHTDRA